MAVVLNKKNNVKLKIEAPMTSVSNLLIVDKGELLGDDFTSAETEKHFKGTLFKFDGENVSQIEISKVITKSGNFLTLERAVEPCPMNYSSNQMYQQAYDFEAGDWFYINLTAGDLEDIITELKNTNTRIDTTNTNILNNYVSNAQLEAQKGQPGGIATLDENSKIPGTQINTQTLEVSALNSEFIAGENITAGDVVALTQNLIENYVTATGSGTTRTITIPQNTNQTITVVCACNITSPGGIDGSSIILQVLDGTTSLAIARSTTYYSTTNNVSMSVNFTRTTSNSYSVKTYAGRSGTTSFSGNIYAVYSQNNECKVVKALMNNTDRRTNFVGFAQSNALTGENVKISSVGFFPKQGVEIGADYGISKTTAGQIEKTIYPEIGKGVKNNLLLIEKNIIKISLQNQSGIQVLQLKMGRKPIMYTGPSDASIVYYGTDIVIVNSNNYSSWAFYFNQ